MSVLVIGISHRSAPVSLLERVALDPDGAAKLIRDVADNEHVTETTVLATCNRCEVYADVDRFHGSVEAISTLLCERAGVRPEDLLGHLYVHYDDAAVSHLFSVASGLDSMVVGESQVLGQVREALRTGQETGTVGPALNLLFQQALRVGKRAHTETDIDHAAPSVVSAALERAAAHVGGLAGRRALVVGAGAMAGLAVATLARSGIGEVVIANRTARHAERLSRQYGARAIPLAEMAGELGRVDVLVSCTGASGVLLPAPIVAAARNDDAPLAILDLALPHDVDPAVAALPGVRLVDLATLARELEDGPAGAEIDGVRAIVGQELSAFLGARRAASVTPTVVALRTMATGVVDAELERLHSRLPELADAERAEVELAIRRVADKLLHQPTVRVKELANATGAVSYAAALAELFALDPEAVEAVTRVDGVAPAHDVTRYAPDATGSAT
jgi:glutamyl-tRNA reductase